MTSWAEDREYAALEKDDERQRAEQVPCPEPACAAGVGETCRDLHSGQPLGKLPAHWRRIRAANESAS